MYASAGGGPLSLVRGGAAREFTVTVSNGIRLVDTTAPESAPYEPGVPAATSLTVTARRG
ncbi:hypothetical protein [Streptomyces sp. NPDC006274]|uniref:hypothetical protein n=1 Tax=unclassified Streptomyces TaxID=2593676 RepID=UPI0033BDD83D